MSFLCVFIIGCEEEEIEEKKVEVVLWGLKKERRRSLNVIKKKKREQFEYESEFYGGIKKRKSERIKKKFEGRKKKKIGVMDFVGETCREDKFF